MTFCDESYPNRSAVLQNKGGIESMCALPLTSVRAFFLFPNCFLSYYYYFT